MTVSELVRVAAELDEQHRCRPAERAAGLWAASGVRFIRSSASHVFRAAGPAGTDLVLRLRPDAGDGATVLRRSAATATALHVAGAAVAPAVPSTAGELLEVVDGYVAVALAAVDGEILDDADIDPETAREWGRLLADLHGRGADADAEDLPNLADLTEPALAAELTPLPRDPAVYGLLHGDPEPDNVVWTTAGGVFVDLDDVRQGWYAADVAFALRAWGPVAGVPDLTAPVPAAFVAGYRDRRPLGDDELAWMPRLARAAAAETLARLAPVVAEAAQPDWPAWARRLHERVRDRALELAVALDRVRT